MDTPPVSLKGMGDGLKLTISPDLPENQILDRVSPLFSRIGKLARGARITVSAPSRPDAVLAHLRHHLSTTFKVGEVRSDESVEVRSPSERRRIREASRSQVPKTPETLMMHGRIRSGQRIESKGHLVLLGDVNPGAEVVAHGDILILGALCGSALAGQPDNPDALIWARDFRPQQIRIAGCVAAGQSVKSPSKTPEFARLEQDRLVVAPHDETNPFAKLPWPVNR